MVARRLFSSCRLGRGRILENRGKIHCESHRVHSSRKTFHFRYGVSKTSLVMVKLRAKCLLFGDDAVGKSSLSHIFYRDGNLFQKNYSMTTGMELLVKCVSIPETNDSVELYILDTAGKETLLEACEKMWGDLSLLCLVFDLTNEQSFVNCNRWMERVRAHCQGLHVPGVLVGNKSDLTERREVEASVAEEWAQSQRLEYHETSAKEMTDCETPFLSLARAFHSLYQERCETIQNLSLG